MESTKSVIELGLALLPGQPELGLSASLDSRAFPRFDLPSPPMCRLTTVTGREGMNALVLNISCGGIRLLADMPLARGTCLMTELRSQSGLWIRLLLTHIIHVAQEDDGRFSMGCEFLDPLSVDELRLFVA